MINNDAQRDVSTDRHARTRREVLALTSASQPQRRWAAPAGTAVAVAALLAVPFVAQRVGSDSTPASPAAPGVAAAPARATDTLTQIDAESGRAQLQGCLDERADVVRQTGQGTTGAPNADWQVLVAAKLPPGVLGVWGHMENGKLVKNTETVTRPAPPSSVIVARDAASGELAGCVVTTNTDGSYSSGTYTFMENPDTNVQANAAHRVGSPLAAFGKSVAFGVSGPDVKAIDVVDFKGTRRAALMGNGAFLAMVEPATTGDELEPTVIAEDAHGRVLSETTRGIRSAKRG